MTSDKLRIGFIALGVLGACWGAFQLWAFNPQPDPPAFAMVGIDPSATVRLNVVNIASVAPGPCLVEVGFADHTGRILLQANKTLMPGQADFLDLGASALGPLIGTRAEIRPIFQPVPVGDRTCRVAASVEVFDNASGRTLVYTNPAFEPNRQN